MSSVSRCGSGAPEDVPQGSVFISTTTPRRKNPSPRSPFTRTMVAHPNMSPAGPFSIKAMRSIMLVAPPICSRNGLLTCAKVRTIRLGTGLSCLVDLYATVQAASEVVRGCPPGNALDSPVGHATGTLHSRSACRGLAECDLGHRGTRHPPDEWAGLQITASMLRHWAMNTSNWPHFVCASRWLRATIFALFSRTAASSFLFWAIILSRVTMSHPLAATSGIHSVSRTSGLAIGQGGRWRLWMTSGSPGYVTSLRRLAMILPSPIMSAST